MLEEGTIEFELAGEKILKKLESNPDCKQLAFIDSACPPNKNPAFSRIIRMFLKSKDIKLKIIANEVVDKANNDAIDALLSYKAIIQYTVHRLVDFKDSLSKSPSASLKSVPFWVQIRALCVRRGAYDDITKLNSFLKVGTWYKYQSWLCLWKRER